MRVALVHDWLTGMRGGEKVLEVFCRLFPDADLFTLIHVPGSVSPVIEDRRIVASPVSRLPGIARSYRNLLPLYPRLIERFDFRGYELVLSSSSCVAKGAKAAPGATHVSYVHSPMRYVWDRYDDYFGPGRAGLLTRTAMSFFRGPLQRWDRATAERADVLVANSEFVATRIRRYYGRRAEVIPPPVDTRLFRPTGDPPGAEWLAVSAFAPYKRLEVAIRAADLAGVPLAVVGSGPQESRLRAVAGPRTRFLGWVPDEELVALYSRCRALLFPAVEDFGIAPVEAMACGRPVVALGRGGARDSVVGGRWEGDPAGADAGATGLFVDDQTPEAFAAAIRAVESAPDAFRPEDCRRRAEQFDTEVFRGRIADGIRRWRPAAPSP
jgi:glycosyltransferase involved in cell wall biosynthesis